MQKVEYLVDAIWLMIIKRLSIYFWFSYTILIRKFISGFFHKIIQSYFKKYLSWKLQIIP